MQSKLTKLVVAVAAAVGAIASLPAHAGALAMSDLNITSLFLADSSGKPSPANFGIVISDEMRNGTVGVNYNGVKASSNDLQMGTGVTLDPTAVCAGPSCGSVAGLLYGGSFENNTISHVAPPAAANYAVGDVYIEGTAIGGVIKGITRADAVAMGPTNSGGANSTLLNTATLTSNFTVNTSFSGYLAAIGDAYFRLQALSSANETATASAGMGWNVTVACTDGAVSSCTGLTGSTNTYTFIPSEFNLTGRASSKNGSGTVDVDKSFNGQVQSAQLLSFVAGNTYSLTINQSSNAIVTSLPEPASLALVGISMLGLGFAGYRRNKKA